MIAVINVIANRARDWGWTIKHVILGHDQFTSMVISSDPEFILFPKPDDAQYAKALAYARQILANSASPGDNTGGAHWYANLKNISENGWFERNIIAHPEIHPVTSVIGRQTFYA